MTREENLHWIDEEIRTWENECQSKHPIKEALYAARKALEQEPCEDAVSRAEVKKIAKEMYLEVANMNLDVKTISDCISYTSSKCREVLEEKLKVLPSVTPQPPKGHWIEHPHECGINWEYSMYECSECHEWTEDNSDFCPNCGADMSEEKK